MSIISSTMDVFLAAAAAIRFPLSIWHRKADDQVDLELIADCAAYMEEIRQKTARHLATSIPDEEWLAVIKARAQARVDHGAMRDASHEEVRYEPVPWEIVEHASA